MRRVKDAARQDELFPVRRYHPFFTDTTESTVDADITHRRHAVIETVFADSIDGPLAHMPSGRFGANSAWVLRSAIAHNLLRAAGTLADPRLGRARGATLRRKIIAVPARFTRPQRKPVLHLLTGPGSPPGSNCGTRPPSRSRAAEPTHIVPTAGNNSGKAGQTSDYLGTCSRRGSLATRSTHA